MSTRGIIAVYAAGEGRPERSSGRPWRGVYHHYDSYPTGLGQHLLGRVAASRGDVASVEKALIDEAPRGWSICFGPNAEKFSDDEVDLEVRADNLGLVDYVYVFDVAARRLDLFQRESDHDARWIESVTFSEMGEANTRAFRLNDEEKADEAPLPGKRLEPAVLDELLRSLPNVETPTVTLNWVLSEETEGGGLQVVLREVQWDDEGSINGVIEQGWQLVPPAARLEPKRVENCLRALAQVLKAQPKMINVLGLTALDPLLRSGARQQATFEKVFRSYAPRFEA
jgi:hypothetical protein